MPGAFDIQVGDSDLLNADFGSPSSGGASSSNPYGYGSGTALGLSVTTETVIPGINAGPNAGADQTADFQRYLGMAGQVINLINPFTSQYQNEQGIRLTQAQADLERARAQGAQAGVQPASKDNTLLFVVGGVAALGLLVFVSKDKG
jgi:hypothetical protein